MKRFNLNLLLIISLSALIALSVGCGKSTEEVVANAKTGVMVKIVKGKGNMTVGESQTFIAQLSDLADQPVEGKVAWTSSDPAIAAIDASGQVTALAPGQVTIKATYGEESARRKLRIKPKA